MKIKVQNGILTIRDIKELDGAESLSQKVRAALPRNVQAIELDLTQTQFVNSGGLGELIALYKLVRKRAGKIPIRLVNASRPVSQFLELTRLHDLFEILTPLTQAT